MRSRNGNFSFVFTSIAVICTLSLKADNYYIGYRFTAKNTQAINETFSVSKAMQPCITHHNSPVLILKRTSNERLETILKREENSFLEFAASDEVRVKSNDTFGSSHSQTLNSLILPTKCYAVEFNDESVTITATK